MRNKKQAPAWLYLTTQSPAPLLQDNSSTPKTQISWRLPARPCQYAEAAQRGQCAHLWLVDQRRSVGATWLPCWTT